MGGGGCGREANTGRNLAGGSLGVIALSFSAARLQDQWIVQDDWACGRQGPSSTVSVQRWPSSQTDVLRLVPGRHRIRKVHLKPGGFVRADFVRLREKG
jgi:hypothetical protein